MGDLITEAAHIFFETTYVLPMPKPKNIGETDEIGL